jgi:hypothetical protein
MATMTDVQQTSRKPRSVISILSLIGGIIGVAISFAGWGILLPIAAVILGLVGRAREKSRKRLWLVGMLLGVIGIVISVISLFYQYLALLAVAGFAAG